MAHRLLIFNQELLPHNYIIHRNDRKTRGGGVLIATKNNIPATLTSKPDHIEIISLHLTLCCIYIPPNSGNTLINDLTSHVSDLVSSHSNDIDILLVGDFNMPDIDWDTLSSAAYPSVLFCDFIFKNNHSQLIDKPTHNKGNILDLILTNACHRVQDITISPPNCNNVFNFKIIQLSPSL